MGMKVNLQRRKFGEATKASIFVSRCVAQSAPFEAEGRQRLAVLLRYQIENAPDGPTMIVAVDIKERESPAMEFALSAHTTFTTRASGDSLPPLL